MSTSPGVTGPARWGQCLLLLLYCAAVHAVVDENYEFLTSQYLCPRGNFWSLVEVAPSSVNEEIPSPPFCYTVVNAMTFQEALQRCHADQSSVLPFSEQYQRYRVASGIALVDQLAKNGVTNLWYGLYIKDNRLVMDDFPMTQRMDPFIYDNIVASIPWDRSGVREEPLGTSNCFEIAINLTACSVTQPDGITLNNTKVSDLVLPTDQPQPDLDSPPEGRQRREADSPLPESSGSTGERRRLEAEVRVRRQIVDGNLDLLVAGCEGGGQKVAVRSRDCHHHLPFLCVKAAVRKAGTTLGPLETLCQPDEFGNAQFSRCFSYGEGDVDYQTAQSRCQAMKTAAPKRTRTLYRPLSFNSSPFLHGLIVDVVIQSYERRSEQPFPQEALAWVGRWDEEKEECLALSISSREVMAWDCSAHLPFFVCQEQVYMPEPSGVADVSRLEMVVENNLRGLTITDIPGTPDREVKVPYSVYSATAANRSPQLSCLYSSPMVRDLQTMTLVKGGSTVAQINSLSVSVEPGAEEEEMEEGPGLTWRLWNGVDYREDQMVIPLHNMTDYYWCEINDLRTGSIHQSGRVFVRPKEVGVYAVSVAFDPQFERSMNPILTSLMGQEQYFLSSMLFFRDFQHRIVRVRPDLHSPESTKLILDLHLFNTTVGREEYRDSSNALRTATASIRSSLQDEQLSDIQLLRVRSIDICPSTRVEDPVSGNTYLVPDTELGAAFISPDICLATGEPYVTLRCGGDKLFGAKWLEFTPIAGCNFRNTSSSTGTATLKNISESDINDDTIEDVITDTEDIVATTDDFVPVDVVYLADILQQVAAVDNITVQTGQKILELVDKVSTTDTTVLEEANVLGNATNRILKAVDDIGDQLLLDDNSNVRLVTPTTAMEVWNLSRVTGDVIIGLELRLDGEEAVPVLDAKDLVSLFESSSLAYAETDAAILLPEVFVRQIQQDNPGRDVRLTMNVFANTALFRLGSLESRAPNGSLDTVLNSKVISARVAVDGQAVSDTNSEVVTTVYLPIVEVPLDTRALNSTCVFWDFSGGRGQGAWSDRGCRYNRTLKGRDVCVCDHLTNFAVLLDVYGQTALPQDQQFALSIISIIGLSLSIAGLAITVLSFLLIKKLRQGKPQQTLFNMALAMLASWVVFLAGFTRTEHHVGCVVVAVLLHYFILASFMWMLMEGVLQYLLFVKVFGSDVENYMVKTAVPAWGLPLIPVIVILAIDTDMYRGGEQYCWMSLTPFYYAFLIPVALILIVNIVVYVMVVVNICRRSKRGSGSASSNRAVGIRASVACFIVLGLSWVFAFLAVEDARVVFQYLFTITTSLQGLLIFLVFTARDPVVRAFWRQVFCCGKYKEDKSSSYNQNHLNQARAKGQDKAVRERKSAGSQDVALSQTNASSGSSSEGQMHERITSPSTLSPTSSGPSLGSGFVNQSYE